MGFPSPAEDYLEPPLDLNDLVGHPLSTFYVKVGTEPDVFGIHTGDILVVDRALPHTHRSIVVATIGETLLLRRLRRVRQVYTLVTDKGPLPTIEVRSDAIWGFVTYVIHRLR